MDWDADGLLPVRFRTLSGDEFRSPYNLSLPDLIRRFGGSGDRIELLRSLVRHRISLRNTGVEFWFQWVDGSFVEDAVLTRGREPKDIDLVTFYRLPDGRGADEFQASHPDVFDQATVKGQLSLDSYCVPLNGDSAEDLLLAFTYWRDWWSHTREGVEKGYVYLDCL